jgi:hypothetical protein
MPRHFQRVSDKLNVMQAKILYQYGCAKQGLPFGIGACSHSQVVEELWLTTNHDSCFHRARVGATATIEEYLEPASHACHRVAPVKESQSLRRPPLTNGTYRTIVVIGQMAAALADEVDIVKFGHGSDEINVSLVWRPLM